MRGARAATRTAASEMPAATRSSRTSDEVATRSLEPPGPRPSARLLPHRVALSLLAEREDALVVVLAQLPLELVEQRLRRRQELGRLRLCADVLALAVDVAVGGDPDAVGAQGDLEPRDLVELLAQVPAALLDRLAHALVVLEVLEGDHHDRALRHAFPLFVWSWGQYGECAGRRRRRAHPRPRALRTGARAGACGGSSRRRPASRTRPRTSRRR